MGICKIIIYLYSRRGIRHETIFTVKLLNCAIGPEKEAEKNLGLRSTGFGSVTSTMQGAIIGDGDRNEFKSFTIARATPCEVRFGLFLAQIAPSLRNKKRAL